MRQRMNFLTLFAVARFLLSQVLSPVTCNAHTRAGSCDRVPASRDREKEREREKETYYTKCISCPWTYVTSRLARANEIVIFHYKLYPPVVSPVHISHPSWCPFARVDSLTCKHFGKAERIDTVGGIFAIIKVIVRTLLICPQCWFHSGVRSEK